MKQFLVQFRKDFTAYFSGLTAYSIIAAYYVLSFFSALYLGDYFLRESDVMNAYFSMQPFVLILIIPAITMRSWAEETKSGTLELLLTQPIPYSVLVFAKYCASFVFFLLLISFSLPFLIISSKLSVLDWGGVCSSYCGLLFCGALFTAVGCLVSTLCRNNIISFVGTIFVLFFIVQLNFSAISGGLPLYAFNFIKNYEAFLNGFLLLGNSLYFIIGIALLLWMNTVILIYKQNKNSKETRLFKIFSLLFFLIFFISVLSSFLFFLKNFDVTTKKLYTLSKPSMDYLDTINKRIDITLYEAKSKREDGHSSYAAYANFVERFLKQIQQQSSNAVRYTVIRVEPFSTLERRLINENIPYEEDALGHKSYMVLDVSDSNGTNLRINSLNSLRQNFLEADIMRLIRLLGHEKKNIAVIADADDLKSAQGFYNFLNEFYNVTHLNFSLQYLPSTYDAAIIINPQNVTIEFLLALDQYILNGGNIALFDKPEFINKKGDSYFVDFLKNYGIKPIPEETIFKSGEPFDLVKTNNNQWKGIRFILSHNAGEVGFRKSPLFSVSSVLTLNDKTIAVLSEGRYLSHFPEMALEYSDVLVESVKEGKFFFIYDSNIINDSLYVTEFSKGFGFYQIISQADNSLFYIQLIDKLTGSKTEEELTYHHYPMNLTSIGNFVLNTQRQRHAPIIKELQQRIDDIKQELDTLSNFSVHNMGRISQLTQDLEKAEDKLNQSKLLIIQNYRSMITVLTIVIILVIPCFLLCLLALFIRIYQKCKHAKIRRLFNDIQAS